MKNEMEEYFSGKKIYGDDFSLEEIEKWYEDEKEGYSSLIDLDNNTNYSHHALNELFGFKYLKNKNNMSVLGLGSAQGEEFIPILDKITSIKIIEPSDKLTDNTLLKGIDYEYVKPQVEGTLSFNDNSFDLITCFGVLHHIPNVSYVITELYRCLKPGGILLIREPISSMGDWRFARLGVTKRERGLPLSLTDSILEKAGFSVLNRVLCIFPVLLRLFNKFSPYNNIVVTYIDAILCKLFSWNIKYHRPRFIDKLSPGAIYYVVKK